MKKPNTILIVDNKKLVRDSTCRRLETKGYRVFSAGNQEKAARILAQERIDVAIIDIRLVDDDDSSDVSGLDFAANFDSHVAKIILTGFRTEENIRKALVGYLNQIAPAQDVIKKQDGPRAGFRSRCRSSYRPPGFHRLRCDARGARQSRCRRSARATPADLHPPATPV